MGGSVTRRQFVGAAAGAVAAFRLPSVGSWTASVRAQGTHPVLVETPLTDRLTLWAGAGANVVAHRGLETVVLVNGGSSEHSAALLEDVGRSAAGKPVAALFNLDWHRDHTGSNVAVGRAGASIVAHEYTRQYLGARRVVDWEQRTYEPLPAAGLPTSTFYTHGEMDLGDELIEYGSLGQAHTDGDIYVCFREANVLLTGHVMTVGTYPLPDYTTGGWLGGMVEATETLLSLADEDTRIVPSLGPVQPKAALLAQHEMLATLRDRLGDMMKEGMSADDMLAAGATAEFDAQWGDPRQFVANAYRSLWLHVRELGGIV